MKTTQSIRILKNVAHAVATLLVAPELASFHVRSRWIGRDRALEGSTQLLGLVPGLTGQSLRRAFLSRVLAGCHRSALIEAGTTFSKAGASIGSGVYIGIDCRIGLAHIGRDVLIASGVHIPSGSRTHGSDDLDVPIRDQAVTTVPVHIGEGAWIGSAAVVMADVGAGSIVGAGAVVTRPVAPGDVVAGVPARTIRRRLDRQPESSEARGMPEAFGSLRTMSESSLAIDRAQTAQLRSAQVDPIEGTTHPFLRVTLSGLSDVIGKSDGEPSGRNRP